MRLPSLDMIRVAKARRRLIDFTTYTYPNYLVGWFQQEVAAKLDQFLDDVIARRSPRLMLFAPPRSGKSELVSRRFPSYALGKHPDLTMIATSYSGELASRLNRDVQRIIDDEAYGRVFPGTSLGGANVRTVAQGNYLRNSDIFEVVGHRGSYRSAGVQGSVTGMGSEVFLIDDPVKDAIEADSATYRERAWEWYRSVAYTRLAPGGGILLIMTRWHEDDLAGRILQAQKDGGEKWEVVRYPAIAEQEEPHRKEGEALHRDRYDEKALERIKLAVGSRVWSALYQQRPAAAEGGIFKRQHWRHFKVPPHANMAELRAALQLSRVVQAWDTAFKKGQDNDPSSCTTIGVAPSRYYILDSWTHKVEYPELKRAAIDHHAKWQPDLVLVEDKASGQSLVQELSRETRIPLLAVGVDSDKVARANAVTPVHEAGLCYLPEGEPWVSDFVDELASFPTAPHDDRVDSFDLALGYLTRGGGAMGIWEWYKEQAAEAEATAKQAALGGR